MNKKELLLQFDNYLTVLSYSSTSRKSKLRNLSLFLDWVNTQSLDYLFVNYRDILAYVNFCKSNQNVKRTVNHKLKSIEQFYQLLEEQEKVDDNPCEGVQLRGIIRRQPNGLLSKEELETVYQNYPSSNAVGKRNKAILSLLIYQGLGAGEVTQLKVEDIKLEQGKIYIPKVGRSNSRTLDLEAHQMIQLQQYIMLVRPYILSLSNKESEQLFISSGASHRISNVLSILIKNIRKYNLKVTGVKQIRASIITYWLSIHNIRQVQYMAGHRYVSSTEHYRVDKLESLQEQIDLLHPANTIS